MSQQIDRLTPYLSEIEKILQEVEHSPVLMAKAYIENTLLSNNDKEILNKYAYDYFKEIYNELGGKNE